MKNMHIQTNYQSQVKNIFVNEILSDIGSNINILKRSKFNKDLTGFIAMKGNKYNKELMVIGRSVNGWRGSIPLSELNDVKKREEFAEKVFNSVIGQDNKCPMLWVTEKQKDYNTNRSAFWRVIKETVKQVNIENFDISQWPSYLVWSNLCKVSPANGGNPNDTFYDVQLSGCIKMLNFELETYMPKRVLFLTGMSWAKYFLDGIGAKSNNNTNSKYVESYGQHCLPINHQFNFAVAVHPQGRKEEEWVRDVCKFLL